MDWCLLEEAFLGEVVNISTSLFIGGVRPRRRVCGVAWVVGVGVGVGLWESSPVTPTVMYFFLNTRRSFYCSCHPTTQASI